MGMAPPPGVEMTDKERRLWELRQRMNRSRKMNHKAVVNEAKGRMDAAQGKKREREYTKRADKFKEKGEKANPLLQVTAEQAAAEEDRQKVKKKKAAAWGWEAFNQDTLLKAYDKRLASVKASETEVEQQKAKLGTAYYDQASALNYGDSAQVSDEGMNRMVAELVDKNERSKK